MYNELELWVLPNLPLMIPSSLPPLHLNMFSPKTPGIFPLILWMEHLPSETHLGRNWVLLPSGSPSSLRAYWMTLNCPVKCSDFELPSRLLCRRNFSRDLDLLVRSQPINISTSLTLSLWCFQLTTAATLPRSQVPSAAEKDTFVLTRWGKKMQTTPPASSTTTDPIKTCSN